MKLIIEIDPELNVRFTPEKAPTDNGFTLIIASHLMAAFQRAMDEFVGAADKLEQEVAETISRN